MGNLGADHSDARGNRRLVGLKPKLADHAVSLKTEVENALLVGPGFVQVQRRLEALPFTLDRPSPLG